MPEPTSNDFVVNAQTVANVEDAVLADAQAQAAEAEHDEFEQNLASLDEQLSALRDEERRLRRASVQSSSKAKLSAVRKRIGNAVKKRQDLFDARDERERIQVVDASVVTDDVKGEGESQHEFLVRTGKVTPFQGKGGYERQHADTGPTRRRLLRSDRPAPGSSPGSSSVPLRAGTAKFPSSARDVRSEAPVGDGEIHNNDDDLAVRPNPKRVDLTPSSHTISKPALRARKRPRSACEDDNDHDYDPHPSPQHSEEEDDDDDDGDYEPDELSNRESRSKAKRRKSHSPESFSTADDEVEDPDMKSLEGDDYIVAEEEELELEGGLRIPASIFDRLFPYQRTAVQWLWELHCQGTGGILGDEMGLGKTVQIAAFLGALNYSSKLEGSVLVLAPTTVLRQWQREFRSWWPRFRVRVLHHSEDSGKASSSKRPRKGDKSFDPSSIIDEVVSRKHGVLITSYEQVRKNSHLFLEQFEYVIADEGHKMKSPDAEITITCKKFNTPHRIIVSGTPLQNHLKELWSLFDFVYPGKLGTLPVFHAQFVVPIAVGAYSTANKIQVHTAYKCSLMLRDVISPYLLRRLKKDVAKQLPQKDEQILFVKLTSEQREKYKKFLESRFVRQVLHGKLNLLYAITALRKICNHSDIPLHNHDADKQLYGSVYGKRMPRAQMSLLPHELGFDEEFEDYGNWKRSGKMVVLDRVLAAWKEAGSRVLVFSQTTGMLDILEKYVRDKSYTYLRMDGGTSIGSRMGLIDRFNRDTSVFVFLLTTRVGGLGVNLTGADRVVVYDPDWNPTTDLQARERAWRIGQKRPVTVYRLLTSGTIEEKIYHRQIQKQFLTNKVLTDPRQRRFFKPKAMRDLFTLAEDEEGTETGDIFAGTGAKEVMACRLDRNVTTEGADVSKGEDETEKKGNASILNSLLNDDDKGTLHSTINHDDILGAASKSGDWGLVEYEADRVAEEAFEEMERSAQERRQQSVALPTWTGRSGLAGFIGKGSSGGSDVSPGPSKGLSLLAKIKAREGANDTAASRGVGSGVGRAEGSGGGKGDLMADLIEFFKERNGQCTSQEVVDRFRDRVGESGESAVVFKSMLKRVAKSVKGEGPGGVSVWKLTQDML